MKIVKTIIVLVLLILACVIGNTLLDDGMITHDISLENAEAVSNETAVNINSANVEELCDIKYIGKTIAGYIIDYRETFGKFESIDQIKNIDGISDKIFEEIKPYINLGGE